MVDILIAMAADSGMQWQETSEPTQLCDLLSTRYNFRNRQTTFAPSALGKRELSLYFIEFTLSQLNHS